MPVLANEGVTVMVDVMGVLPPLAAVKAAMSPLP